MIWSILFGVVLSFGHLVAAEHARDESTALRARHLHYGEGATTHSLNREYLLGSNMKETDYSGAITGDDEALQKPRNKGPDQNIFGSNNVATDDTLTNLQRDATGTMLQIYRDTLAMETFRHWQAVARTLHNYKQRKSRSVRNNLEQFTDMEEDDDAVYIWDVEHILYKIPFGEPSVLWHVPGESN